MIATDEIRRLIQARSTVAALRAEALGEGMRTLRQDGIEKVLAGILDMVQVRKICAR